MRKFRIISAVLTALFVSASTVFADIVDVPIKPEETEAAKGPGVLPIILVIAAVVIIISIIIKSRKK